MFEKILVANRGEIASRVIRTVRRMGIGSVAVYSEPDYPSSHVAAADEAFLLGPGPVRESYLNIPRIMEVIRDNGVNAVHPGYGFLSESVEFSGACEEAGIVFIGPTAQQIGEFGLKHRARELAVQAGVPLLGGTGILESADEALGAAEKIGFPVMLKSTAGGGGIGMQACHTADELIQAYEKTRRLAESNFGNASLFLEKLVVQARHVEVQLFGDGQGKVVALGERDCSVQRRNQKVIEESPAIDLPESVREEMLSAAVRLGESVRYRSAGTVEFLYDATAEEFYFLEVNTRLQVEHGVTEEVWGVDLVEWMIRCAAGELDLADLETKIVPSGHAIEARLYAENPAQDFRPSPGLVTQAEFPTDVRIDGWIESGVEVPPFYDPLLAKIIVKGENRREAMDKLVRALEETRIYGVETNGDYLEAIARDETFRESAVTTKFLSVFEAPADTVEVLKPGAMTSVQDFPGREGFWEVGVPPSGPMDSYSFRCANSLLGNPERAAGLEVTMTGPELLFHTDLRIAVCGAEVELSVDGVEVELWKPLEIRAGQRLKVGNVAGGGCRTYIAMEGGLDLPLILGSRSTFVLGKFGGHSGRVLRQGDLLRPAREKAVPPPQTDADLRGQFASRCELGVIYGPHGAPDFFTPGYIETFFSSDWTVHYNSDRTGIRLVGPKPEWAREDGGEAGLHPSNIHDNAYAIGAVDFTGDMPVILGPDGPSLGGFVCPATVIHADLWKLGQLKAGDIVRFHPVSHEEAVIARELMDEAIASLREVPSRRRRSLSLPEIEASPVISTSGDGQKKVVVRPAGDSYLLVEFGPNLLDLELRFLAQLYYAKFETMSVPGIVDITPGIRSLQVHYDPLKLSRETLLETLGGFEADLPPLEEARLPSRIVWLPLSWDDPATREAIEKYDKSVRRNAPWHPSNIEFIRRINGLQSIDEVKRIVFDASYLVLGLGDVYLGAPVATPVDPCHRLVTTKYNPARTWTAENSVGIGGAYLCVYGMEGPGGYQFVGRTIQMWNPYRSTADFEEEKPWLLRHFDQIRFYPVSEDELTELRRDFVLGRCRLKVEETAFSLEGYQKFLEKKGEEIAEFKRIQQKAFEDERRRWEEAGPPDLVQQDEGGKASADEIEIPEGAFPVVAEMTGVVWKLAVSEGDTAQAGETVVVLEAMKMEMDVLAGDSGKVTRVCCEEGMSVQPGQVLAIIEPEGGA